MIDPRISIIDKRLSSVKTIIAVTGWKGGVGKSMVASVLSLILSKKGFKTGLFDLDFTGASVHIILGAKDLFPKEENGIIPPEIHGIKFMSASFFSKNKAIPLRGDNVSDAIIELFAITQWGDLDYLIIDMPPGINDAALDVVRLIKRAKVLAITIPSVIAMDVLKRSLELYKKLKVPVIGVLENMVDSHKKSGPDACDAGLRRVGTIKFDSFLESSIGDPEKLAKTNFYKDLLKIVKLMSCKF